MTLNILTLVLNGHPFLPLHLPVFEALDIPWHWSISEGQAANVNCSRWCKKVPAGLSTDGSHEYLDSIRGHPNVSITSRPWWQGGKREMCDLATSNFKSPGVLLQNDVDEFHSTDQLRSIARLFEINRKAGRAYFPCRFYVGPQIMVIPSGQRNVWLRAWRFSPGMKWKSHEPPILNENKGSAIDETTTEQLGLTFDHFSYVTEAQVAYKEAFYGYTGALQGWRRLQENTQWPVQNLREFLPWAPNGVKATLIPSRPAFFEPAPDSTAASPPQWTPVQPRAEGQSDAVALSGLDPSSTLLTSAPRPAAI